MNKFLAGESDTHGVLGEELSRLEPMQEDGNFTIYKRGPAFGTTFLTFNMNPGSNPDTYEPYLASHKLDWFSNKEFRQAVAHSIDKDAIIDDVQHGAGYPQWSSISPAAGDFHNPNVRRYEYDIDKANAILDGLGWVDTNGNGTREDAQGNEIEFSFVTNSGNSVRERVGETLRQGMEEIGLGVDYRLIEFGDLVSQLTQTYEWEAILIGFTGGTDPHSGISFWHTGENLHLWYPNQPSPATEWEAEIDELYITASRELDREERIKRYHRTQEIAAENVPVIYTTLSERLSRHPQRIRQRHPHTLRPIRHPLPLPHRPLSRSCHPRTTPRRRYTRPATIHAGIDTCVYRTVGVGLTGLPLAFVGLFSMLGDVQAFFLLLLVHPDSYGVLQSVEDHDSDYERPTEGDAYC